jgi:hypothetical protein
MTCVALASVHDARFGTEASEQTKIMADNIYGSVFVGDGA